MSKGKAIATESSEPPKDHLRWSEDMDYVLLNALTEEAHKGHKQDGSWSTAAYNTVVMTLRDHFCGHITVDNVKNRLKTLKRHFGQVYDLFNSLSGFAWNPMTEKFEAEDEVWEDLIKAKPYAARWRRNRIKHYDMLKELFGADRATGKHAATATERLRRLEHDPIDLNDESHNMEMPDLEVHSVDDINFTPPNFESVSPTYGHGNQCSSGTSGSKGTKRKAQFMEKMEAQFEKVSFGINTLAEAVKDVTQLSQTHCELAKKQLEIAEKGLAIFAQSRPHYYSEEDVWNALQNLGLAEHYQCTCYRYLIRKENENKKREFFGVPPHMRLQILLQIMAEAGLQ